jgi:hypothetical protein
VDAKVVKEVVVLGARRERRHVLAALRGLHLAWLAFGAVLDATVVLLLVGFGGGFGGWSGSGGWSGGGGWSGSGGRGRGRGNAAAVAAAEVAD